MRIELIDISVMLLDGDGRAVAGPRSVLDVARPFLERTLGAVLQDADAYYIMPLPYAAQREQIATSQRLRLQAGDLGYFLILTLRGDALTYRHPHLIAEVLETGLQSWLTELEEPRLVKAFRIDGDAPAYRWGDQHVPQPPPAKERGPAQRRRFRVRAVTPPPLVRRRLAEFGADPVPAGWLNGQRTSEVQVLLSERAAKLFEAGLSFSNFQEDGGFLIGSVFEDAEEPSRFLCHIADAVPAEQTRASFLHITFAGESFAAISRKLAEQYQGLRLLGWYHTHLFPATGDLGLSSTDLDLHFGTFSYPWQTAALINLDGERRTLRFYTRRDRAMALCHYQRVGIPWRNGATDQ